MSATAARKLGIFGGTFDPVHFGHLRTALELKERVGLDEVRFVPAANPPHRASPIASETLRLHMLETAIAAEPSFVVDRRELDRGGPSYTVDTLVSLREEWPHASLVLMLGLDAFADLPTWHHWQRLLDYCHIAVARRPGASMPRDGELGSLLAQRRSDDVAALADRPHGVVIVQDVTQLEISSTDLRASIRAGVPPRYLMPETVGRIVMETGCYAE